MAVTKKDYDLVISIVIAYSLSASLVTYASTKRDCTTTIRVLLYVLGGILFIGGFVGLYRLCAGCWNLSSL